MPEVTVRKRARRRPKKLRTRLERWFYENRPQIVVVCAFVLAGLIGAAAVSFGLHAVEGQGGGAAAASN